MSKYKTEDKNTIRAFGGNRIIQENDSNEELSDSVDKNLSKKPKSLYSFGYNRIISNTPN